MLHEGDNMMGVKRTNRSAALRILHEQGSISRKRLAESIKLTPAAITKIVGEMIAEGIVVEGRTLPSDGVGRGEGRVELNSQARCALGVLINLNQALLSAVWLDGSVIFFEEIKLVSPAPAEETVKKLSARLMSLVKEKKLARENIVGLGIAIRGVTSPDGRSLHNSFGAIDAEDFPICEKFEEYTGLSTVLSNNVRALFAAHMFLSRDKNSDSQFFLRCEYGIGASLSMNDRICLGTSQQCAEIGHIPVVKRGGKPCSCGKCGCLETVASPTAIREDALSILSPETTPVLWNMSRGKEPSQLSLDNVLDAARYGDEGVAAIVDKAVLVLGNALKSVIYILDPGKIVLYGRMFENSYYLSKLIAEVREGVDAGHSVAVEKSQYNCTLERIAAGVLAVEDFLDKGGLL